MSQLHPVIALALAPWIPRTEEEEARWIAADLAYMRKKQQDLFRQAEADAAQRREADFDQMQSELQIMSQLPKTLTGKTTVWLSNKYYGPTDIVRDGTKAIGILSYSSHDMFSGGWMAIGEAEVTINFYPMDEIVDKRVKGLREEQKKTLADAQLKSTQIEREIQSLLAITNEVTA